MGTHQTIVIVKWYHSPLHPQPATASTPELPTTNHPKAAQSSVTPHAPSTAILKEQLPTQRAQCAARSRVLHALLSPLRGKMMSSSYKLGNREKQRVLRTILYPRRQLRQQRRSHKGSVRSVLNKAESAGHYACCSLPPYGISKGGSYKLRKRRLCIVLNPRRQLREQLQTQSCVLHKAASAVLHAMHCPQHPAAAEGAAGQPQMRPRPCCLCPAREPV